MSMWCIYRVESTQLLFGKKMHFILLDRFDFHMIDNLSIAVLIAVIFSRWDAASKVAELIH